MNKQATLHEYAVTTPKEAEALLSLPLHCLLTRASQIREHFFGRKIVLCSIINAKSGNCTMNCSFCSQSRNSATPIEVFPLLPNEILTERILQLASLPVQHIGLVTSGSALQTSEIQRLAKLLLDLPHNIRQKICMSLGRLQPDAFLILREAGLMRYHHNLENAESFYPQICTTQTWLQRKETVLHARQAGLQNCTGGLFGLGESWRERIAFAFSLKHLGIMNIPLNFLHPHPATPLAERQPLSPEEALRCIALFRHILPNATLRICGGRPITFGTAQKQIFAAGANALMTGNYLTTSGQALNADLSMLKELDLDLAT